MYSIPKRARTAYYVCMCTERIRIIADELREFILCNKERSNELPPIKMQDIDRQLDFDFHCRLMNIIASV